MIAPLDSKVITPTNAHDEPTVRLPIYFIDSLFLGIAIRAQIAAEHTTSLRQQLNTPGN